MPSHATRIPTVDRNALRPSLPLLPRGPLPQRSVRQQQHDLAAARLSGITPEPDLFNILILNYTMKCPLACDYCCYHCSPKRQETMDLRLALDLVDQGAELGVFRQCGFTGGEALIYYDDVMQLTARMQQRGMPFSMISSCYWATAPAEARRVLGDLKQHGIDVFSATHDPSHENWVPVQYVRNAVEAALGFGVRVCLCSSFYDDSQRLEAIFPEYAGHPDIDIVNRVVAASAGQRGAVGAASGLGRAASSVVIVAATAGQRGAIGGGMESMPAKAEAPTVTISIPAAITIADIAHGLRAVADLLLNESAALDQQIKEAVGQPDGG